ncbi:otogelin isoform X2 [Crotalus tigris]|uniref:otogelin isoform X2 n=1 Tax=Crotalus tigris TaxID=88082 RepID=UPI00192F4D1D|nr:otogelin isoform X2 [Crotalus tigris]
MEPCSGRFRALLRALLLHGLFWRGAAAQLSPVSVSWQSRNDSSAVPQKRDPSVLSNQVSGFSSYNSSSTTASSYRERRFRNIFCDSSNLGSFACFNGGECVHWKMCNCSRYNATGSRCQIVHNMGTERDNICRTWGQYHYETFDGLYYFFSGKSTYVLVRQNELDEQSFSIQIHNDPECSYFPYSCKRSVSLYFSGEEEIRLSNEVTYKGIGIQLPYTIGKLHIQKVAGYVIVRHQYAFSLAWDGISAVYIKMAPDYLGKTHGLCGNNNAILQDELSTSYEKITEDIEEFVESWRENPPQENIRSWGTSFSYEPPCLSRTNAFLQRTYTLCSVLLWSPFKDCHEFVSPFPFMASCTNDLCMSGIDNTTWCRALTEYARTCAQAGRPLHEWRANFEQCVVKCEEHLVYNECIDCCPFSCRQKTHCVDSELPCVDGCYCPDGLIYEDRLCVRPTDCPCDYHGTIHRTGTVVQEECNNCTCSGGKWICTNLTCPAQCSVSGDIHFMTFDGRKFTFQAPCQYILAKSRVSDKFAVTLQNAPCGQNHDGTCMRSISLIFSQDFRRQVTLTHSGDVLVHDQYKVNLPYIDDSFEIRKLSSVFLQIKSYIGLQILYDWKDDTIGLCGTFNGNTQDDFLSPVGVPETTPQLFGNSWKTSSSCSPGYDSSSIDPCDVHLQAAAYATEACSIITRELFAPCYTYLSPLPYFEQCRRDTCKCGQICMCSALSHYAHLCHRFGVEVNFRSSVPECALSCEDTKEYSTCVSTCGRSCRAFSVPEACDGDCVEGCTCPSGMYLNIKTDRCVPQNECPCYFHGIDYPPGENIITSFGKCHCRNGMMNCEDDTDHDCPEDQIYVNCSHPPTMGLDRERTCENQLLNISVSTQLSCFSGCTCPTGLFKYGDMCFKPNECPCSWKGKEYFPGDKVISSCHTCICSHGSFKCNFHPCPSMCTAYGDRHYRTFDGLSFDYVGNCKVYLVKSSSITSFSVIIENVNCFNIGIICRKYVSINVGKSFIIFDDDTGDPSHLSYIDKLQQVYIWKAGFFTIVHFPNEHITVMWDQRTTVHVETGPQWQGELTGLCGNFDSKTINEMRTPENFELTNAQEFGSSWAAIECADSSDIRHPCILNPLREAFAKKECGILLSEIFESCHPVVDVTWFYSNCLIDTCGCNQGGDCECFCTSVSAYAHQCCQQGVTVDWRSPRLCPYDCEYINKVLGKGPYKLVSYLDGKTIIAAKLQDGSVFPAKEEDLASEDALTFMLTSPLYKPKAHDPHLVSLEAADRPNYFLYLASNNTLVLSKWERNERFQNRSTFAIHKNTWFSGYSSFESFAIPGLFIYISASSVTVVKFHHSQAFRLSTLFKLVDSKFKFLSRSTCEWRYDACSSPCFKTCRDPFAKHCQTVPKVEGCVPMCPLNMVLDELTQRCVYFEDCIEPTTEVQILQSTLKTHTVLGALQSSAAVLSKEIAFSVTPASKLRETTPASKQQFSSTIEKAKLSTFSLPNITLATSALSVQSTFDTSALPGFSHLLTDVSPISVVPPSATDVVIDTLQTSSMTSFSIPSISTITEAEIKLTATPTSIVTPSIITEDKSLDTSRLVSQIKAISAQSSPTEDIERKLQNITESQTSSIIAKRPEHTSQFFTKSTLTSLEISSPLPTSRQTTPSSIKSGVTQSTPTITNVTETSFAPLFTTLVAEKPVLKPGSSETSKTTVALIKEQPKSTIIPITLVPTQLPHMFLTYPSVLVSTTKKEVPQTSNVTYQTSSYFSLYTPLFSKPQFFTSKLPRKTDLSSTTIVSKKYLQTEQPLFIVPNITEPATASSDRVTPLSTIVTSKTSTSFESSIPISQKISTEHKIPLLLKTTKTSVPDSGGVTKSKTESAFITEVIATVVPGPLVAKKVESVGTTEYPFIQHAVTDIEKATEYLSKKELEKTTRLYTRKPSISHLPMSLSTIIMSKIDTALVPSSPEIQVPVAAAIHPVTSKTTYRTVPPSTIVLSSTPELTVKESRVTLSPYTKLSSRSPTEVASIKDISTLFSSATLSVTTFPPIISLVNKTSLFTSTQQITIVPTTATPSVEPTKSFVTSKFATSSVYTSAAESISTQVKDKSVLPYLITQTPGKHDSLLASKAYLTTKGTSITYQFPVEQTGIYSQSTLSTTESVKIAVPSVFQSTSHPFVTPSVASHTSSFSPKIPLVSDKETTQQIIESFSTEKLRTHLPTTKQALSPSQLSAESTTLFHVSKSTSPSLFILEAPETSVVSQTDSQERVFVTPVSTAFTFVKTGTTEKTLTLSKQMPLSAISSSSAPIGLSGLTTKSVTKTLEKTAGTKESITSLLSVLSDISEIKSRPSKIVETDGEILATKLTLSPSISKHSPTFLAPFSSTNETVVPKSPSVKEATVAPTSSLPILTIHPNATRATAAPIYSSTKPVYDSGTIYAANFTTVETMSGASAPAFISPGEIATQPTCIPVTENDCIKHICLDGQLIQVNQSQYCPYSATQTSCGFLGFAVQINGDKCCPKWECACRCTFFSDLSFITFDGHHMALFKEASYIISQTQDEVISIHVVDDRNTNMGNVTYFKLSLTMLNLTYLSNQIIIDRLNRKIVVNSKYAWPTVKKYDFKIEDTGFMYLIKTPTNTKIQWFHNTGMMIIEHNATSDQKTMGLCGFCDGISTNDLMLPNNTVVRTAAASVIFTDSWLVPNTLKYIGEPRTHEANCSAMNCSFCLNMLLSQTFSSCHPYITNDAGFQLCQLPNQIYIFMLLIQIYVFMCVKVSPASFCDLWIQDTGYIQDPCLALSAYVAMCNKFNICIEWRNSSYCSFPCPEGFSYKACIHPCNTPSTCQSTESTAEDSDSCLVLTEGCTCAEGTILHRIHSALCIPEEKCACTDHSGVPHAVGEIWKSSSSDCCMHKCVDSNTIAAVEYNCSVNYDVRCQRFGEVALIVPDDQSCCHQKVCTCNQSLCDTLVPECKVLEKLVTYYQDNSCCPNYTCECDPEKCKSMEPIPHCRSDQTLVAAHVEGTCCFSYICSCSICSDQIPMCQEGERLTVDGNTTDRCCPDYQCVCETFRCPEFKCMLGMSLIEVWSPEKCCPYRRCECACNTIPKPQCKLGEKMVLDEKFQNSTENVCHCTKYKCSKDKVCLNNERGVLLPGQSIVEHSSGGICHTSYCTNILDPVTKFYRMNTSIIDCAARCKSHQVYERPKDLTTCCGKCKNVSCVHTFTNGTISYFKPGSSWTLNCLKYDCINTSVGSVLITSPISCPPFNETECVKIGGYIVPFLEGCCKTCKEDGKFCKKVTVRMTIRKNDCRSNTPVNIVSCDGKCPSASIYNYNINTYARFCKCCRELGLQRRTVQLYCSGNSTWVSYTIQEPTDCSCQWS